MNILIEGWRAINHSYALVNQWQLLEMKNMNLSLCHYDLPFFKKAWNSYDNDSGFKEDDKKKISLIRTVKDSRAAGVPDITYRISFPYRFYQAQSEKLFIFGTSERQNIDGHIFENRLQDGIGNPNLKIITPSNWSKIGFVRAGFDESSVLVVPHGINENYFKPVCHLRRRQFRDALKFSDDDFVLLSLGAMTHNKGIDILILAFAHLKSKYPHLKLVLKDSSNLYGIKISDVLNKLFLQTPWLCTETIMKSITMISSNLTQVQLNGLYGAADCYVSPYRCEGFNLPPLEAAASGTPIIITKGGSTDDCFDESFALHIESSIKKEKNNVYLEPMLDSLIDQISRLIEGDKTNLNREFAQQFIKENFTWATAVKKLFKFL